MCQLLNVYPLDFKAPTTTYGCSVFGVRSHGTEGTELWYEKNHNFPRAIWQTLLRAQLGHETSCSEQDDCLPWPVGVPAPSCCPLQQALMGQPWTATGLLLMNWACFFFLHLLVSPFPSNVPRTALALDRCSIIGCFCSPNSIFIHINK